MDQDIVTSWLNLTASGNRLAREKLIEHYRPFILNETQRICRRPLQWGRDDELSIALIAFNEAIDAYRDGGGSTFNSFCSLVIKRRLVDYFRREKKQDDIPDSDKLAVKATFDEDWERSEREAEIEKYDRILNDFNLNFKVVAERQPTHKRTRKILRRVAKILAGDREMMNYLRSSGNLPKSRLCEQAGVTPRILERGRIYVIALALLLSEDGLPHLQSYARELTDRGDT